MKNNMELLEDLKRANKRDGYVSESQILFVIMELLMDIRKLLMREKEE